MIRGGYILIFILALASKVKGQTFGNSVSFFDDSIQRSIEFGGYGSYGSTVLDIQTMNLFYQGGFFNEELKNESIDRLGGKNLFGGEFGFSIGYNSPYSKILDSAGYYVNYEIAGAAGADFTSDLYQFVFQGNQQFSGDTAYFSGSEFSSFVYRKIGFGYNQGNHLKVGLSLMTFDNFLYGSLDQGIYYGGEDTLGIRLSTTLSMDRKINRNTPVAYGLGFDFEVNLPFDEKADTANIPRLVLGVKNLGLFMSAKTMDNYRIDSIYKFSGVEMNDLISFQSGFPTREELQDSLMPHNDEGRIFRMLPFEMYFYSTSNPFGKKMQLIYGMRYRYGVGMLPQVYIGGDWRPSSSTIITPFFSLGGYSYAKFGLAIRKKVGNLKIGLSANNVPGFISQDAYNRSLSITLSYGFK